MTGQNKIYYLRNSEIDRALWDKCIGCSANGLIYGYSFYLDHMAGNWDALVLNNYEAVMPLPWRRKGGISYVYQPFLSAQLGVFGGNNTSILVQEFLRSIPKKFKYLDFPLNSGNGLNLKEFPAYKRSNYTLDLNSPYTSLYAAYRENIKRNIRKSEDYGCYFKTGIDIDEVIRLAKEQLYKIPEADFLHFKHLYTYLKEKKAAETYGIFSKGNELVASCAFYFSHNRAYYILVGNHPNGRTLGASHALIDSFIKEHAENKMILDFEGSDIRNLAFFYSSFGSKEEKYLAIRWNRLQWYLKWLKN